MKDIRPEHAVWISADADLDRHVQTNAALFTFRNSASTRAPLKIRNEEQGSENPASRILPTYPAIHDRAGYRRAQNYIAIHMLFEI